MHEASTRHIIEVIDEYNRGFGDGVRHERKHGKQTQPQLFCTEQQKAEIVKVVSEEVSRYAVTCFADGLFTFGEFVAVMQVADALGNVSVTMSK
jgi:hypothetical protein